MKQLDKYSFLFHCRFWDEAQNTVEPRYNKPLYNEVLGITPDFLYPVVAKDMKKDLDIKKPRYSEENLPVPWPFVILKFLCIN